MCSKMRSSTLAEMYGQCTVHYSAVHFHVALQDTSSFNNSVQLEIGNVFLIFFYFEKNTEGNVLFFFTWKPYILYIYLFIYFRQPVFTLILAFLSLQW